MADVTPRGTQRINARTTACAHQSSMAPAVAPVDPDHLLREQAHVAKEHMAAASRAGLDEALVTTHILASCILDPSFIAHASAIVGALGDVQLDELDGRLGPDWTALSSAATLVPNAPSAYAPHSPRSNASSARARADHRRWKRRRAFPECARRAVLGQYEQQ